jgi:hypothetical protein
MMNGNTWSKFLVVLLLLVALPVMVVSAQATTAFRVNTFREENQEFPAVAMDSNGNFVVVWAGYGPAGYDIYARLYDAQHNPLGDQFFVNDSATDLADRPDVGMDAEGNFVVVWQEWKNGDYRLIKAQRFDNQGEPLGNELVIEDAGAEANGVPSIAVAEDGKFVVTWQRYHNQLPVVTVNARYYNNQDQPQSASFEVSDPDRGGSGPDVAMDQNGNFVIIWSVRIEDKDRLFARRYNTESSPQGAAFEVNIPTENWIEERSVAMDASGDFVVTWERQELDHYFDVYARRYNSAGVPQGVEFVVNTYRVDWQGMPAVSMSDTGEFLITWFSKNVRDDRNGIYAQWYDQNGNRQGKEFGVSEKHIFGWHPAVAVAPDLNFVVVWDGVLDGIHGAEVLGQYNAPPQDGDQIYVSVRSKGKVQGIKYVPGDILSYDSGTNEWALLFDASSSGIARNLRDFVALEDGTYLMTFDGSPKIHGVGRVPPQDVVQFAPIWSDSGFGQFTPYFDGSDVGLTSSGESIDALSLDENGNLILSTSGQATVNGLQAQDKDLLRFIPISLGGNTAGAWQMFFDGSDVGLTAGIQGIWIDPVSANLYLTFDKAVHLNGQVYSPAAVVQCEPISLGQNSDCDFSLYWDAAANGLVNKQVDGLELIRP